MAIDPMNLDTASLFCGVAAAGPSIVRSIAHGG